MYWFSEWQNPSSVLDVLLSPFYFVSGGRSIIFFSWYQANFSSEKMPRVGYHRNDKWTQLSVLSWVIFWFTFIHYGNFLLSKVFRVFEALYVSWYHYDLLGRTRIGPWFLWREESVPKHKVLVLPHEINKYWQLYLTEIEWGFGNHFTDEEEKEPVLYENCLVCTKDLHAVRYQNGILRKDVDLFRGGGFSSKTMSQAINKICFFADKLQNFEGKQLRFVSLNWFPFVNSDRISETDPCSELEIKDSTDVRMLLALARFFNFR